MMEKITATKEENRDGREYIGGKTQYGTEFSVKKWLNKDESRTLHKYLAKHSTISADGKIDIKIKGIEDLLEYHDTLISIYVDRINGSTDVMAAYNAMREEDAEILQEFVVGVYGDSQKKTTPSPTNTGTTSSPAEGS